MILVVTPNTYVDEQDGLISASNDLYIYEEKYRESVSVTSLPYRIEAISKLGNIQKDLYAYAEENCLGVAPSLDNLARLTYDLLDANKIQLVALASDINAPQWALVILSVCGEPPNVKLITMTWGKFMKNVLEYAAKKRLSREARISLVTTEIVRIRAHLSSADQYCAIDSIVEGFETRYVTVDNVAKTDPAFVVDTIINGLRQDISSVVDVYRRLFGKFASGPVLSPHLLHIRVHVAIANSLIDGNGNRSANKDQRRLLYSTYARTLDGYLRTATRQQLADEEILTQVQTVAQKLASLGSTSR